VAEEIAGQAPLAVAEVIRVVDEGLDLSLEKALGLEAEAFGRLCDTADKAEGTKAFLEKRKAEWGGKARERG
jgi:enoyl-CoA hydratase